MIVKNGAFRPCTAVFSKGFLFRQLLHRSSLGQQGLGRSFKRFLLISGKSDIEEAKEAIGTPTLTACH